MKGLKSFLVTCLLSLQSFGTSATSLLDVLDALAHFRMVWNSEYASEPRNYFEQRFGNIDPATDVELVYSFMALSGESDSQYKYGLTEIDTWGTNLYFALCCSSYGVIDGPGSSAILFVVTGRGRQIANLIIHEGLNNFSFDRERNRLSCRWCRIATPIPESSIKVILTLGLLVIFWYIRRKSTISKI